jgi:hypothetical protein
MRVFAVLICAIGFVFGSLHAAEAPPEQPAASATKPAEEKQEQAAEKAADDDPAARKPAEKSAADQKQSPQRFIPSEQVRADFDVSFPIDI